MSREPGILANNNGQVLQHKHVTCGTLMVDHASDCMFHFFQKITEGSQAVEVKNEFETFASNCGV